MRLLDLRNRPHLFDCCLDLLSQKCLLEEDFSLCNGRCTLFWTVERLEGLQELSLDPVVYDLKFHLHPVGVILVDVKVGFSVAKLFPLLELLNHFFPIVVPLVRIDVIAHIWQPHGVVVNVVKDLRWISMLQVCPHILMVEDHVNFSILAIRN